MASYNTINAHDADCRYPAFLGLNQYGQETMTDQRYATDEKNVETINGTMQPCAKCELLPPTLESPIETLALLHRRWTEDTEKDILVAASGGKLYWAYPDATEWAEIWLPEGVEAFESSEWSCVTYEINPEGSAASVDVLLMSNAKDGMVMVRGDTKTATLVETPKRFGVIERYAERIWGGAIEDDPDMLVYSAPFDPTDWEADAEIPEDGAGDVMQPSWDGDAFTAIKSFGSQLIAFKRTRVWRVYGTNPGEYMFNEQYGGGVPYAQTIGVDVDKILALTDRGPVYYDGSAVQPFYQEYVEDIFHRRINKSAMDKACACMWRGKYYAALPVDGSEINNAVLVYDSQERTWLFRDDLSIESFLPGETALYFTSSTTPGQVWLWHENSWETGECTTAPALWISPWTELGYRQMTKGPWDCYLLVEVKEKPVTLRISVQTEKKTMTKKYIVWPVTDQHLGHKQKRIHFPGYGRRFRLIIESEEGSPCWRLIGGVMLVAEVDRD